MEIKQHAMNSGSKNKSKEKSKKYPETNENANTMYQNSWDIAKAVQKEFMDLKKSVQLLTLPKLSVDPIQSQAKSPQTNKQIMNYSNGKTLTPTSY